MSFLIILSIIFSRNKLNDYKDEKDSNVFLCRHLGDSDSFRTWMLGPNSDDASSNTTQYYGCYYVTNCTQVKSYGYNGSGVSSTYYAFLAVYEMTENADGSLTRGSQVDWQSSSTANTTVTLTSTTLDKGTIYCVYTGGYRNFIYEVAFQTPLVTTETTLANIESEGDTGKRYKIEDELVAVYADIDNGLLWCKDQGNASINPSSIIDGQIDFMNDANLTGTTGQCGRDWDQSNWVALKFPADQSINSLFSDIEGKKIAAGTVTGRYIDNENYTIEVLPVNNAYTLTFNGTAEYSKNVYCAANFLESNLNIGGNTGAVGVHGDNYFFMNPKIQEVCHITYAMWDGEKFVTPNSTEIQGAFNVNWSYNIEVQGGVPTLAVGETYQFDAVVCIPATRLNALKGGGTPSDNFLVYPTSLTGSDNIITGINDVYVDGYREVVGVEYVNSVGMTSDKPFQGLNIVVTRYSDGSHTAVKKIFK